MPVVGVAALIEDVAAVADLQAAAGVLLDHDRRHAGLVDVGDADEGVVLPDGRQARRRLVEQQHGGVHHERARHRDHLPLAAGERAGALLEALAQLGEDARHELEALVVGLRRLVEAHLQVLLDRERGEDVVVLRHEADAARRRACRT